MRTISLSLLLILIANTIGGICMLFFHHQRINEYVKSFLQSGYKNIPLIELEISNNESAGLIWLEEKREFTYRGEMYDVVKIDVKKNSTVYHCINDKIENGLMQELANNNQLAIPGQHNDRTVVLQFFKIISQVLITQTVISELAFNEKLNYFYTSAHLFQPVYLSLTGEPPDIV